MSDYGILEWLILLSTLMELNPLFQGVKILKHKNADNVSLGTFFTIFSLGSLWIVYAIKIGNVPLILGNLFKLCTSAFVMILYFKYGKKNSAVSLG